MYARVIAAEILARARGARRRSAVSRERGPHQAPGTIAAESTVRRRDGVERRIGGGRAPAIVELHIVFIL